MALPGWALDQAVKQVQFASSALAPFISKDSVGSLLDSLHT